MRSNGHKKAIPGCLMKSRRKAPNRRFPSAKPYAIINLRKPGTSITAHIHHLVLLAFVGPRPEGQVGCHNDDDETNNSLSNLRWDTKESNWEDRRRNSSQPAAEKLLS